MERESKMFSVGDKVRSFGLDGVITGISNIGAYPVSVKWDSRDAGADSFTLDGRFSVFHKEPAIVLVEKAKKKIKLYKYIYSSSSGNWNETISYFKDDSDFKNYFVNIKEFKKIEHTEIEVDA